jgi:hypothetical protein
MTDYPITRQEARQIAANILSDCIERELAQPSDITNHHLSQHGHAYRAANTALVVQILLSAQRALSTYRGQHEPR